MKRILFTATFAVAVGVLSAQAQNQDPTNKDQGKVVQDTVIDNSNIPDTAGSVIDDDNTKDKSGVIENENKLGNKSDNFDHIQPADKVKTKPKEKP